VSVKDISDDGTLIRRSDPRNQISRMPTPKFQLVSKSSLKASFPESYYDNDLSSSMGKHRELPDDNILNSSYKLLLSPAACKEPQAPFDLATDLNSLEIKNLLTIPKETGMNTNTPNQKFDVPKILITDHDKQGPFREEPKTLPKEPITLRRARVYH